MKRKLLLLCAGASLTIFAASCIPQSRSSADITTVSTPAPVEKMLSAFNPVEGTHYLMAEISANPEARTSSGSPFTWLESGYSRYSYATYNFVFFDLDTESYHRLLPTNESVILQITGFPIPVADPSKPDAPKQPIEWWVYTIARADTDGNGVLDYDDKLALGVSDVGGNEFTEMVGNVDSLLGTIYKDASSLFVMYHSNGKNYLAKINLLTREIVMTTEMDLGEDVK